MVIIIDVSKCYYACFIYKLVREIIIKKHAKLQKFMQIASKILSLRAVKLLL